jgi:hypothetical protein
MNAESYSRLVASTGTVLLLVGLILFYASLPSYSTAIETKSADKRAMADEMEQYSVAEIDAVPFANLSSAEQTAFTRARQSPQNQYSDRGASDDGSTFDYRNDIVTQYFVAYDEDLYLVSAVIDIHPLMSAGSAFSGFLGIGLLGFAYWIS